MHVGAGQPHALFPGHSLSSAPMSCSLPQALEPTPTSTHISIPFLSHFSSSPFYSLHTATLQPLYLPAQTLTSLGRC